MLELCLALLCASLGLHIICKSLFDYWQMFTTYSGATVSSETSYLCLDHYRPLYLLIDCVLALNVQRYNELLLVSLGQH